MVYKVKYLVQAFFSSHLSYFNICHIKSNLMLLKGSHHFDFVMYFFASTSRTHLLTLIKHGTSLLCLSGHSFVLEKNLSIDSENLGLVDIHGPFQPIHSIIFSIYSCHTTGLSSFFCLNELTIAWLLLQYFLFPCNSLIYLNALTSSCSILWLTATWNKKLLFIFSVCTMPCTMRSWSLNWSGKSAGQWAKLKRWWLGSGNCITCTCHQKTTEGLVT